MFCSFVIAVGQLHRADDYIDALIKEAGLYKGASISSVYFGGGTPSNLNEVQLGCLADMVRQNFSCCDGIEWTMEGNPEGLNLSKTKFIKSLGINRFSLGVQSLNDTYLKFLGRAHDSMLARRAFDDLRSAGFNNINLDLMYAFPGQTSSELAADVKAVAAMGSEHLSLYSLTVEEKSRFYAEGVKLDEESRLARHYLDVCRILEEFGIEQYEVSNFCRKDFPSRHNIHYWKGGHYIGLGVGAHSHLNGRRSWNVSKLHDYLDGIKRNGRAMEDFEDLSLQTRLAELLIFGLRMNEGVIVRELEQKAGVSFTQEKYDCISRLIDDGFLEQKNDRLKTSLSGRLVLDEISSRLV